MDPDTPSYSLPSGNRCLLLTKRPTGVPGEEHFTLEERRIPEIGEGQFLVRNLFLSVDPAQRGWASDAPNYIPPVQLGSVMRALGVGVVIDSRHADYPEGSFVYGWLGWQDYAAVEPGSVITRFAKPRLALSAYAGLLGISGLTAQISLDLHGRLRESETVLVSAAAGAVGSLVGQIAKLAGARTIGIAGSQQKIELMRTAFGYDAGINYKTERLPEALSRAAPDGVDLYFDNVGGAILDTAVRQMASFGRVIQCGTAAVTSWAPAPSGLRNEREILVRRLSWNGFVFFDHASLYPAAFEQLERKAMAGRLTFREHILDGLEAAPRALPMLFDGSNDGKMLIWVGG